MRTVRMPHRRDELHLGREERELRRERQPGFEESAFTTRHGPEKARSALSSPNSN